MIILEYSQVTSTQDIARELAEELNCEFAITAETQTSGRGRRNRVWYSPIGGLYTSIVLRQVKCINLTSLGASALIAELLRDKYGIKVELKWPNDLIAHKKKLGGILVESKFTGNRLKYMIIGIGINTNNTLREMPKEIRDKATSILELKGEKANLEELNMELINKIQEIKFMNCKAILSKWLKYNCTIGRKIEIHDMNKRLLGIALKVDADGALIVRLMSGELIRISSSKYTIKIIN